MFNVLALASVAHSRVRLQCSILNVLKVQRYFGIELTAGEVVRHSILMVCDVGDPIVGIDVVMAEDVEAVNTYPDILQVELSVLLISTLIRSEAHADIDTLICRCTEILTLVVGMRRSEWQTIGKGQFQGHTPAVGAWEIVGKEEVYGIPLVGRQRNGVAAIFYARLHQRE